MKAKQQLFIIDPETKQKVGVKSVAQGLAIGASRLSEIETPYDKFWREDYEFYGQNKAFFECKDRVVVLSGPAETGKSISALCLIVKICIENENARIVIARKVREDMGNTVIQSFRDSIIPDNNPVNHYYLKGKLITGKFFGGERPTHYQFSNGSVIYFLGLDKPGKVLSGAFNTILVNQAEELEAHDYELLTTRITGRGTVKLDDDRPNQLVLDCNPGPSDHHILTKKHEGLLTMFNSVHRDNPTLYDQETGEITEQGEATIEVLSGLTGINKERLFYGKWVAAEGLFFKSFNPSIHGIRNLADRIDFVNAKLLMGMDFGYQHANVAIFAAEQGGFLYVFDELVSVNMFPEEIAPLIFLKLETYGLTIEDFNKVRIGTDAFSKTGRSKKSVVQQYRDLGINFSKAYADPGSRVVGATTITRWLGREAQDGLGEIEPILFYDSDNCPEVEKVFLKLVYDKRNQEDVQKQENDDSYDALRYCLIDKRSAKFGVKKSVSTKQEIADKRKERVAKIKAARLRSRQVA